jgi:hypothetical protein
MSDPTVLDQVCAFRTIAIAQNAHGDHTKRAWRSPVSRMAIAQNAHRDRSIG